MSVEATDIEKKSLEAHVELCAERYNALEDKMTAMSASIAHLCDMVQEVKSSVSKLNEKLLTRPNSALADVTLVAPSLNTSGSPIGIF